MNSNEKYNRLVYEIGQMKEKITIYPNDFGLDPSEFKGIVKEIESDGLFKKGYWSLSSDEYNFEGLTFKGRGFIENSEKKEYIKMEKTEINNTYVSVDGNNTGTIIAGNNNSVSSEYELKFNSLIEAINNSSINDKDSIIAELRARKDNKTSTQKYLGTLLAKGAEVASIATYIGALLGLK